MFAFLASELLEWYQLIMMEATVTSKRARTGTGGGIVVVDVDGFCCAEYGLINNYTSILNANRTVKYRDRDSFCSIL